MARKSIEIEWTEEMIALLGTMTDIKVAAKFGVSAGAVGKKRRELNISPYSAKKSFPFECKGDG